MALWRGTLLLTQVLSTALLRNVLRDARVRGRHRPRLRHRHDRRPHGVPEREAGGPPASATAPSSSAAHSASPSSRRLPSPAPTDYLAANDGRIARRPDRGLQTAFVACGVLAGVARRWHYCPWPPARKRRRSGSMPSRFRSRTTKEQTVRRVIVRFKVEADPGATSRSPTPTSSSTAASSRMPSGTAT